jgi:hypothetical protein
LTIRSDELDGGYCPECFERTGRRHEDFETVPTSDATRYRCEDCGAIIDAREFFIGKRAIPTD